jgi:hypothetical protein
MLILSDVPLSYGLVEVNINRDHLNGAEFVWDPTKESGVYVRVNCISTEFTAKKHGGEKGVPFRLQVETYSYGETESKLIHCGSCQIKVFKVGQSVQGHIKVFKVTSKCSRSHQSVQGRSKCAKVDQSVQGHIKVFKVTSKCSI